MKTRRTIIFIVGSLVAFAGAPSGVAVASSLLSGYGGPGQGNQALLGSALLNGPGGGGGASGVSASSSSAVPAEAVPASGSLGRTGAGRQPGRVQTRTGAGGGSAASSSRRPTAAKSIAEVYNAAERGAPAQSSGTLGLSGSDLLLIVLVLGALALMAALIRRLARVPATAGRRGEGSGG